MTALELEIWKPVVGYEDFYSVSSLGRVMRSGAGPGTHVGRVLKPCSNGKAGYSVANLCVDGRVKSHLIHRLVAAAFIGPCPQGQYVNHIDGDKRNNVAANLEYVTPSGNMRHAADNRLLGHQRVWATEAEEIRIRFAQREGVETIAQDCGLAPESVYRYTRGVRGHKLTPDEVRRIRELYATGARSQQSIADEFRVNQTMIGFIVRRASWKTLA